MARSSSQRSIAVARSSEGSQELIGMGLEHNGSRAHDFPALASLIARSAHVVKTPMRGRQRLSLGQGARARDFASSIHIRDQPTLPAPIRDPARTGKRGAGKQVLLEERAQA